jgi:hypothetical protein
MNAKHFEQLLHELGRIADAKPSGTDDRFIVAGRCLRLVRGTEDATSWVDVMLDFPLPGEHDELSRLGMALAANYVIAPDSAMPRWFAMEPDTQQIVLIQRAFGDYLSAQNLYMHLRQLCEFLDETARMIEEQTVA